MKRLHTIMTVILSAALIVSVAGWLRTNRELRRQIEEIEDANNHLKEALGDLTIAIAQKEKQIDAMQQPVHPPPPPPSRPSHNGKL